MPLFKWFGERGPPFDFSGMPEKSFCAAKAAFCRKAGGNKMNWMKKAVASALAAGMLAGFLPAVSFAETTHNIEQEGVSLGAGDCTGGCQGHVVTGTCDATMAWNRHKIDIDGGTHTIILRGCSIMTPGSGGAVHTASSALDVHNGANVTLVLEGENDLHGDTNHPAIWVEPGSTLSIEGTGALNAYAGSGTLSTGSAAIGSSYGANTNFGDIVIHSGTVYAEGSGGGAGIGGGYQLGTGSTSGNITITGGWVRAFGGKAGASSGAGIGSGENADYTGTVTISGGVVYAVGGDDDSLSIGAGGRGVGSSGSGTFTTGTDGNAVIVAPQGIGHVAGYADWDGIFVSYNGQQGTATVGADGVVHLNDSTANIQVWGQPVLNYDLAVGAGTTLHVIKNDRNSAPATLTVSAGHTLENHGEVHVDEGSKVVLEEGAGALNNTGTLWLDNGVIELWGGPAQAQGQGRVLGTGQVRIPLTAGMVQDIPNQTYTGSEIRPDVAVAPQTMWNYTANYANPADYTVTGYENNINVGTAAVGLAPAAGGKLLNKGEVKKAFEIVPAGYTMAVTDTLTVREGESGLLAKLNALASTEPEGVLGQGTLSWTYNGQPVQADTLAGEPAGGPYTVNWAFQLNTGNYAPQTMQGTVEVFIVAKEVPTIQIGTRNVTKTYGADPVDIAEFGIAIVDGAGRPIAAPGAISLSVRDNTVAEITAGGKIKINNAGTAIITVTVAETDTYAQQTATVYLTVQKKQLNIDNVAAVDRAYAGSSALSVQLQCLDHGILGETHALRAEHGAVYGDELYLKAEGTMANAAAGQGKAVTITTWQLTGDKAGNYILPAAPAGLTVNIAKLDALAQNGELPVANELPKTYTFNLTQLHQALPADYYLGAAAYTAQLEDKNGYVESWRVLNDMLIVHMGSVPKGTSGEIAQFTVKTASTNYNDFTAAITLKAQDETLGSITLANTVAGSGADQALAFRYTVQLQDETGAPYTGTVGYEGTGTVADGQNGIAGPDAQGCLTITLAHGQSVTLKGSLQRDQGIAYTVEQQQVSGYTVATVTQEDGGAKTPGTSAGVSGQLALGGVEHVHIAFTNTKPGGSESGGAASAQKPNPKTGA